MKKQRVRAIIFHEDGLILIKRIKKANGIEKQYHVFPGGGVEEGESLEEAVIREVEEELGVRVLPINQLYVLEEAESVQIFILCEYIEGIIGTGNGEEFTMRNSDSNQYIPEIVPVEKIKKIDLLVEIKRALLADMENNYILSNIPSKLVKG